MLAQLDRRLRRHGEPITLRRRTTSGPNGSNVDAVVPAIVRALTVEQLIGLVQQQNFLLIISPTDIIRQQWPGGRTPPVTGGLISPADPRIPVTSDTIVIRGSPRAIQRVAAVFDAGQCIRIEMTVLG